MTPEELQARINDLEEANKEYAEMVTDDLRWRSEALQVMADWDQCYQIIEAAGHPAPVGKYIPHHVAEFLKKAVRDANT